MRVVAVGPFGRAAAEDSLEHDERVLVRARLGRRDRPPDRVRVFAAVLHREHLTAVGRVALGDVLRDTAAGGASAVAKGPQTLRTSSRAACGSRPPRPPEGSAVRVVAVGPDGRAAAEDSLKHDERVFTRAHLGRRDRPPDRVRVFAAFLHREHLPAVGRAALGDVLREGEPGVAVHCTC